MNNNNNNNNNSNGIFDVLVLTNKFPNFTISFTLEGLKVNYKPKVKFLFAFFVMWFQNLECLQNYYLKDGKLLNLKNFNLSIASRVTS